MRSIFECTVRPSETLFFRKNDKNDVRLGETISSKISDYEQSVIVIIGCPQDEGVKRNGGRIGAALAPDRIREQFYKLTNFGINAKIFDLGNTKINGSMEEIHDRQTEIVSQILKDGKIIISLGGGNDISYPDCRALSEVMGAENILALNIDAHFDVRAEPLRNSGTPYRQLLEEKLIKPQNFFEIGWQEQLNSPIYFEYLQQLKVNLINLDDYKIKKDAGLQKIAQTSKNIFWGFDADAVRAADAPGVSASNPLGFSAEEFVNLVKFAGDCKNIRVIEFTEVNPNFDIDNRTTKLVATAMHKFCARQSVKEKVG